ncbi:acyl-CoA dehydrogenase family protein [Streptomyces thinghirensis]|nr:acyl-CoA dehydrogenase family protein [Streptomyces thinghirensis]
MSTAAYALRLQETYGVRRIVVPHATGLDEIAAFCPLDGLEIEARPDRVGRRLPSPPTARPAWPGLGCRAGYQSAPAPRVPRWIWVDSWTARRTAPCVTCRPWSRSGWLPCRSPGRESPIIRQNAKITQMYRRALDGVARGWSTKQTIADIDRVELTWQMGWVPRMCEQQRCRFRDTPRRHPCLGRQESDHDRGSPPDHDGQAGRSPPPARRRGEHRAGRLRGQAAPPGTRCGRPWTASPLRADEPVWSCPPPGSAPAPNSSTSPPDLAQRVPLTLTVNDLGTAAALAGSGQELAAGLTLMSGRPHDAAQAPRRPLQPPVFEDAYLQELKGFGIRTLETEAEADVPDRPGWQVRRLIDVTPLAWARSCPTARHHQLAPPTAPTPATSRSTWSPPTRWQLGHGHREPIPMADRPAQVPLTVYGNAVYATTPTAHAGDNNVIIDARFYSPDALTERLATVRPLRIRGIPLGAPMVDLALSSDQQDIVDQARAVARRCLAPRTGEHDRTGAFPAENIADLHDAELLGLLVPTQYGGTGADLISWGLAVAELAEACGSTALIFAMHSGAARLLAADAATNPVAERVLKEIASEGKLLSWGFSEPGTGGNILNPQLRATPDGDSVHLAGTKAFCTAAGHADYYLINAHSGEAEFRRSQTMALPARRTTRPGRQADMGRDGHARQLRQYPPCWTAASPPRTASAVPAAACPASPTRYPPSSWGWPPHPRHRPRSPELRQRPRHAPQARPHGPAPGRVPGRAAARRRHGHHHSHRPPVPAARRAHRRDRPARSPPGAEHDQVHLQQGGHRRRRHRHASHRRTRLPACQPARAALPRRPRRRRHGLQPRRPARHDRQGSPRPRPAQRHHHRTHRRDPAVTTTPAAAPTDDELLTALRAALTDILDPADLAQVDLDALGRDTPLLSLPLDSITLVAAMSRIETTFESSSRSRRRSPSPTSATSPTSSANEWPPRPPAPTGEGRLRMTLTPVDEKQLLDYRSLGAHQAAVTFLDSAGITGEVTYRQLADKARSRGGAPGPRSDPRRPRPPPTRNRTRPPRRPVGLPVRRPGPLHRHRAAQPAG